MQMKDSVKKMFVGLISVKNVNGPITIAQVAGETATYGLDVYLGFLALLSISLGVLNLLPIPVLDGGHAVFFVIEWLRGKPVSLRAMEISTQVGLVGLLCFMVVVFYNDIVRYSLFDGLFKLFK